MAIKATASDAYELLTSVKMSATLYYDAREDALVVSSAVPSAWHTHYTAIVARQTAIEWMGADGQGAADDPTDTDCEMVAQWINEEILAQMDLPHPRTERA